MTVTASSGLRLQLWECVGGMMGAMGRMCNEMELGGSESGVGKMMDGNEPRGDSQRGWRAQPGVIYLFF